MKDSYRIGFIGCGNMATAMIQGMVKKGLYHTEEILVSNKTPQGLAWRDYPTRRLLPYRYGVTYELSGFVQKIQTG